ncbi:hypothetical protein Tco_1263036, partial [Tanacetum coccineum]
VEALQPIILVDDNDDFIDDEDNIPHDLADFNSEVLANSDDDDVEVLLVVNSSHEEN